MFHFSSSLRCFFYYVTATLSMLLLQQHIFNGIKITFFGIFKLRIKVTLFLGLPLWNTLYYVTTTFFQVPNHAFLITLQIRLRYSYVRFCLLLRDNFITSQLRCLFVQMVSFLDDVRITLHYGNCWNLWIVYEVTL